MCIGKALRLLKQGLKVGKGSYNKDSYLILDNSTILFYDGIKYSPWVISHKELFEEDYYLREE